MKRLSITINSIILLFFVSSSIGVPTASAGCSVQKIRQNVLEQLNSIDDYSINAAVSMDETNVISHISGKRPNLLRLQLIITNESGTITYTSVFDNKYQWVEAKSPAGVEVLKLKLDELVKPNRPFDTSYYLMGTGLLNGEDLYGTFEKLLFLFDLNSNCSSKNIILSGTVNQDKLKQYALIKRSPKVFMDKFIRELGFLTIEIDPSNNMIKKYSLGSDAKTVNFKVNFNSFKINQGLTKNDLSYILPKGIAPQDITEIIKNSQKK